jgi:hypothetical protein
MSRSMAVLPTSTSQPCRELDGYRPLAGAVVPPAHLTFDERSEMYALLHEYFVGTNRARFEADLQEKDAVILLRDAGSGRVKGFSTLMRLNASIDGNDIVAFFSGDTIVDRDFWGETVLSRLWGQTVFAEADRVLSASPGTVIYWFLICSGYKTWRFLPVFSRVQRILDALGSRKFGDQYVAESGIVRFRDAMSLRSGVADLTDARRRDPYVAFFDRMNPGHVNGDELACLAEVSRANLTRAAQRMISRPL